MNVLVIGGSGHVGSIIRPALRDAHNCTWYDVREIEGESCIVGSVNDDAALRSALAGRDVVVYLAMGPFGGPKKIEADMDASFDVNTKGWYRTLLWGLEAGVRRFVYASSLSVYISPGSLPYIDETYPPDTWDIYGMSKRVSEFICQAAAQKYPDAAIVALRLTLPSSDAQWPVGPSKKAMLAKYTTGPKDLRRLFLAALGVEKPGAHIIQTSGDVKNEQVPNTRATELFGWSPRGE